MTEIGLRGVTHGYGGAPLLDHVDLSVERGERIALVGRNGAGKSTLLAILAGDLAPDTGERVLRPGTRAARLRQDVPRDLSGSVRRSLEEALADLGLEHEWEFDERIFPVLAELGLEADQDLATLSAGAKRRLLLARALIGEPDVLILDEPTNHIDIEGVLRLEERLSRWKGSLLFVTHDRAFLKRVAGRILDLDRGKLRSYECDYATYLARREVELAAEEENARQFDKKLAKEEAWLRRGIKARRTRNQGRVRSLEALRRKRAERRERTGNARPVLNDAGRTGELVIRAEGIRVSFEGRRILDGVDIEVQRGDRVGIVGPNGAGKSTLLAVLLGELEPDAGTVRIGTGVAVGRFDQLHSTLDEAKTVQENIVDDGETVTIGGRTRHVLGYLADFLFSPEQARGPITRLSGGERNRLQLARLLSRPANLLVLDEPTNDLDIETLEVLEGLLCEFDGTLLVVSHDREFLDHVVTQTLVFEGEGHVREVSGGVADWRVLLPGRDRAESREPRKKAGKVRAAPAGPRRRTFSEKRELEELPERIEVLEREKSDLEEAMAAPSFYRREADEIAADSARYEKLARELAEAYARWEELEGLGG